MSAPENIGLQMRGSISESETCSLCFGTGWESIDGLSVRLCECRKRNRAQRLLEAARIPKRYDFCTLENFQPQSQNPSWLASQATAVRWCKQFVREYPSIERG